MIKSGKWQNSPHVAVVGAGIKGLFAARQLCKIGYKVTVFERGKRAGGKINTVRSNETNSETVGDFDNDPKAYVEMGAMRILDSHKSTLRLLEELDLVTIPYIEDNDEAPFVIKQQRNKVENLNVGVLIDAGLVQKDVLKSDTRLSRETKFIDVLNNAFENVHDTILQSTPDRKVHGSGQMSVSEYLSLPGKNVCVKECAAAILALRNGQEGIQNVEAVDEFVNILKLHSETPLAVKGGFDQMITRIIEQLTNCLILYESEVIAIEDLVSNGIRILFKIASNEFDEVHSDSVLIACPAIHKIRFYPELPTKHLEIVENLKSLVIPAMKCALLFKQPFWQEKEHGNIIGGTCWISPSEVNQIYLPSSVSSKAKGYLMIYIRGEPVKRWLKIPQKLRIAKLLNDVENLFPSAKDNVRNLYEDFTEVIWDEEGAGAYVLMNAESIRDSLTPVGRVIFSPVPRGWINDTLNDAQMAVSLLQDALNCPDLHAPIPSGDQIQNILEAYRKWKSISVGA